VTPTKLKHPSRVIICLHRLLTEEPPSVIDLYSDCRQAHTMRRSCKQHLKRGDVTSKHVLSMIRGIPM
jgi:hypothetical protein